MLNSDAGKNELYLEAHGNQCSITKMAKMLKRKIKPNSRSTAALYCGKLRKFPSNSHKRYQCVCFSLFKAIKIFPIKHLNEIDLAIKSLFYCFFSFSQIFMFILYSKTC